MVREKKEILTQDIKLKLGSIQTTWKVMTRLSREIVRNWSIDSIKIQILTQLFFSEQIKIRFKSWGTLT
jgi:hypothetical protein